MVLTIIIWTKPYLGETVNVDKCVDIYHYVWIYNKNENISFQVAHRIDDIFQFFLFVKIAK